MELRHLEALVNLAHHGGFSAAAKALSSTQPTISKAIRQLEHDCGTVLVERLGQGIQLTDAGELAVRSGIAMLAERERLKAELASLQGLLTGRLRLGVPALGSASLFAPLVAKFRKLYPQIEIDLQQHGSVRLEEAVKSGEIEMGATLSPIRRDFDWQLVCEEPLLALLPAGHPLVGRGKVKLRDLAGNPFILFEQGFVLNGRIQAACRKRGIVLTEAARGANADFIIALVAAGVGVALIPRLEMKIRANLQTVESVELDEKDLRWKLGLIWRRGVSLSPPAKHWLTLVREQVNTRKSLG